MLTYFRFLKWLWQLNCVIFLLVFLFIIIPMLAFPSRDYYSQYVAGTEGEDGVTQRITQGLADVEGLNVTLALYCSAMYQEAATSVKEDDGLQYILHFFLGTVSYYFM